VIKRHVMFPVLVLFALLLAGCGTNWPAGIPVYPQAEQLELLSEGDRLQLSFETADPPGEVTQFYIEQALAQGWGYETHQDAHHISIYQEEGQRPGVHYGTRLDITVEELGGASRVEIVIWRYEEYGAAPR
jgi:hypothetical protein